MEPACTCLPLSSPTGKVHDRNCAIFRARSARIVAVHVEPSAPAKEKPAKTEKAEKPEKPSSKKDEK